MSEAKKVGRPTDYDPEMCERVVALGREGASRAEVCYELGICFKTFRNWEEAHPEFLQATTQARQLSQGWWEKQGRKGIWSREFNSSAYSLQVRNRFPDDWRDRKARELSGPNGGPIETANVGSITEDDARAQLAKIQAKLSSTGDES